MADTHYKRRRSSFVCINRRWSKVFAARFPRLCYEGDYTAEFLRILRTEIGQRRHPRILEVGGSDRPQLERDKAYTYHGMDIDNRPVCLDKYDAYHCQPVEQAFSARYDIVFSMTLLEHIRDNTMALASIFSGLNPGGVTVHYVPSKWHPYSIATRCVGHRLQKVLIKLLRPGTESVTGYPAFYNRCSKAAMEQLLNALGFRDINIRCYYGASDYFAWCFPLFLAVCLFNRVCGVLGLTTCASGMIIVARK